jgi:hypothetical protein
LRGATGRRLPVDAYYQELKLVVEYREKQHSEPVAFWDQRQTRSGCNRAQQRKMYDQLRETMLPQHGVCLILLDYSFFLHHARKRLKRDFAKDELVIRQKLSRFL